MRFYEKKLFSEYSKVFKLYAGVNSNVLRSVLGYALKNKTVDKSLGDVSKAASVVKRISQLDKTIQVNTWTFRRVAGRFGRRAASQYRWMSTREANVEYFNVWELWWFYFLFEQSCSHQFSFQMRIFGIIRWKLQYLCHQLSNFCCFVSLFVPKVGHLRAHFLN